MKNVLTSQFNPKVNQFSHCFPEYGFQVEYDEDGREIILRPEVDLRKATESLGTVYDWSLQNLMSAGINPDFKLSTSLPTRIETYNGVNEYIDKLNVIASDISNDVESKDVE